MTHKNGVYNMWVVKTKPACTSMSLARVLLSWVLKTMKPLAWLPDSQAVLSNFCFETC